MLILDKRKYERIVSDLIDAKDIREIVDKFSIDRIYYYHVLKDISSGQRSPNFKHLQSIARKRKLSENFIIEQSKSVLNYFVPYYQSYPTDSLDYYKILNVPRNAAEEEIRRSWIELMKSHHPDKAGADGLDAAKKINEAYDVLGNSTKREAYDNKHLPAMPVIIPDGGLRRYYYAVPIALAIFVVLMYALGSGLIFKSQEEKERLASVIEDPSIPNAVYKGDLMKDESDEKAASEIKPVGPAGDTNRMIAEREKETVEAGNNQEQRGAEIPAGETLAESHNAAEMKTESSAAESPDKKVPEETAEKPEAIEVADADKGEVPPAAAEPEKKLEITEVIPDKEEKAAPAEEKSAGSEKVLAEAGSAEIKENPEENENTDRAVPEKKTEAQPKDEEPVKKAVIAEKAPEPGSGTEETAKIAVPEKEGAYTGGTYHTVKKGESLWMIARKFDTTTAELTRLNNIGNSKINIGDRLLISGNGVPLREADSGPGIMARKAEAAEPAPVTAAKKPEIPKTIITKTELNGKSPEKSDIAADFNPELATSAVAIRNTEVRAPAPAPPVPSPDTNSLYSFVSSYVSAYKNRDLNRVKALFAPDAVENGVSIARVLSSYSSNFSKLEIVSYDVKVKRATLQNSLGYVRGDFFITFKDQRTGVLKNSRGNINWKLAWAGGAWKIQELTYKIESTDSVGG